MTAQILFVLEVLPELKTTGTRLVWRTRPCGTEGNAASQEPKFSVFDHFNTSLSDEPATIVKSYEEERLIIQELLHFQRRSN